MIDLLSSSGTSWLFFSLCFLACCKQFLGSREVFCYVVDYAVDFSEPDIYCRVSSSCGTIDEIKVSPFSPVFLFMLSTVEHRVFYFCLLFLSFFFFFSPLSLSILVYLWNKKSTVRYSLCKRSPDKRAGGILIPGKARAFLYLTDLLIILPPQMLLLFLSHKNRSWNAARAASVPAQRQLFW